MLFLGILLFLLTLTNSGCRPGSSSIPSDWRPVQLSFLRGSVQKTVRIPWWWFVRKPIDTGELEVYYIQDEKNVSMAVLVSEQLRENMVSRYPTAKKELEGKFRRKKYEVVWRIGGYRHSKDRWSEVELANFHESRSLQFWYEQTPPKIAQYFDLIVKQFLDSL